MTTRSYLNTIAKAKSLGYQVTLLFFWLNNVELAIERVKARVLAGGHHIPEEVIRRRYFKGVQNIKEFTFFSDYWLVIDSSNRDLRFIAEGNLNKELTIFEQEIWSKLNQTSHE